MFTGSFNQMHFGEVARLLHSSNQSGVLIIMSDDESMLVGSIYFHEGHLVHASADTLTGLDAINQICNYSSANFSFEIGVTPPEQSLITYPTEKLLEKIQKKVLSLGAYQAAIPVATDIPIYQPGKSTTGLQASPAELALLIQCRGKETIEQIARRMHLVENDVCHILGKFQQVGMIKTNQPAAEDPPVPQTEAPSVSQATTPTPAPAPKAVRYWRGKRIS